jgi:hypothetical protein
MEKKHPILVPNGFQIYTKPTEAVANFILGHIENDHHGASFFGGGGLGKTSAQQYLTDHASRWLVDEHRSPIGVATRLIMPSGNRRSDGAFYTAITNGLRITNTDRLSPCKGKGRLINFVKTRCGQAKQDLMVMFIDNAQRITRAEFDYLADVDEQLTDARLRLFIVFFRQSDASGVDVRDDWSEYPSHMLRRWFMGTHPFSPLVGVAEITHALDRFDRSVCWPTADMPYSRYFAREAFDSGWTLASQAPLMMEVVAKIRAEANLTPSDAWPMATFTGAVKHLLAHIAPTTPNFQEFTAQQIEQAIRVSGYLRLEFVRANLLVAGEAA